ncbi:MAG: hypothetical protein ACJAUP_002371 [Cellvibrionaceae bacterium]
MLHSDNADKEKLLSSPSLAFINLYSDETNKLLEKEKTIKANMDTLSI